MKVKKRPFSSDGLQGECTSELEAQGVAPAAIQTIARAHIRYAGTDSLLAVETLFPASDEAERLRAE